MPRQGINTLSKAKTPRQGTSTLSKAETPCEAKSKHLVIFPSLVLAPRISFLSPTPHGLLAR